ncbi:MAG: hypothetical protein ABIR55_09035, partial [Burkholderiaceae bacterium]
MTADPDTVRAGARAGMRVRLAMLGVLALIALVLAVQGWQNWRTEQLRALHGETIALADAQRVFSQRLSMLATQSGEAQGRLALASTLADARAQAGQLETLLQAASERSVVDASAVSSTMQAWRSAREQFFTGVDTLITASASGDETDMASGRRTIMALGPEYHACARAVAQQVRLAAQAHNRQASRTLLGSTALIIGLMVLLALVVVEPTAR